MNLREFAYETSKNNSAMVTDFHDIFVKAGYFFVKPAIKTEEEWFEALRWIADRVHTDNYTYSDGIFYFEFQDDAVTCSLRWA